MRGPDFKYPPVPTDGPAPGDFAPQQDNRGVMWVFTWIVMCGSVLITLGVIYDDTGPTELLMGLTLAAIPALVALSILMWLDRHEPEPVRWLWFAGGWGMGITGLAALILNSTFGWLLVSVGYPQSLSSVLVAPVVEEFFKCLGLVVIAWAVRREFSGVVDALVYSGFIGIGFAAIENVLYFGQSMPGDPNEVIGLFVVRAVISPFAHPLFTCVFGLSLGLTVHRSGMIRFFLPLLGFFGSVALHGLWNYYAVVNNGAQFKAAYVTFLVPVFFVVAVVAVLSRHREGQLVTKHARGYAHAGWFSPAELELLTSYQTRKEAHAWVKEHLPREQHGTIRTFASMMGDLAALRDRMNQEAAPSDAAARERVLLHAMVKTRPVLTAALSGIGKTPPEPDELARP